jgi:NAD(P)-dependent dehydrogenase (short-subunit alcohol dehydrogenase family)
MDQLEGKIAIVTGTSRGVGVGIAHELLRAGATVIGCSRSALDALPGTEDNPEWAARSAQLVCDQGDHRAIDGLVQQVADTYGRIDILVNNAGGINVPLKRGGEPAEVGRTCVFLASGTADFINGTTIEIDGGMLPGVLCEAGLKTITDLL